MGIRSLKQTATFVGKVGEQRKRPKAEMIIMHQNWFQHREANVFRMSKIEVVQGFAVDMRHRVDVMNPEIQDVVLITCFLQQSYSLTVDSIQGMLFSQLS